MRQTDGYYFVPIRVLFKKRFILLVAISCLILAVLPGYAQNSNSTGNAIEGYPITLDGEVLFRVKKGVPGLATAEERARVINERLLEIAQDLSISPDSIRAEGNPPVINAGENLFITLYDSDRQGDQSVQQVADEIAQKTQTKVKKYREERSFKQVVQGILLAVFSTMLLAVLVTFVLRMATKLLLKITEANRADALDWRMGNSQILNSDAIAFLLRGLVTLFRLAIILSALYLYIPFILSQFPATKAIANSIYKDIAAKTNGIIDAFVGYLPNLGMIAIISFLTYYAIQFAKLVIRGLGRDDAYPWFYPEWTQPTIRLVSFLVLAIAAVVAAPYLPGFGSPAFQGISLFLGALFTLGSSSAIANAISGVILIYTRAYQLGDVIKIGDLIGEVIEKSLFVTRIMTFKKEVNTIPNSVVMSTQVTNFNTVMRTTNQYLLLHTTITLGYDIPWRTIHEVMKKAAINVPGIISNPSPFVLQTALNDYNVSYELNAFTDRPEMMPQIYSQLHQNLQDYCNQAGIEILSPGYTSIRDGNHSTIPSDYLAENYTSPSFQIQNRNGQ